MQEARAQALNRVAAVSDPKHYLTGIRSVLNGQVWLGAAWAFGRQGERTGQIRRNVEGITFARSATPVAAAVLALGQLRAKFRTARWRACPEFKTDYRPPTSRRRVQEMELDPSAESVCLPALVSR